MWKKIILFWVVFMLGMVFLFALPRRAGAASLGIHILQPEEINDALTLFSGTLIEKTAVSHNFLQLDENAKPYYLTIPFPLDQLDNWANNRERWQNFINQCRKHKIIPLMRLTSRFDLVNNAWKVPNRLELVRAMESLDNLNWEGVPKIMIVFNEVNHFAEWGGKNNPESYAEVLDFVLNYLQNVKKNWQVLPAAMDLAAANTEHSSEAFAYWNRVYQAEPTILARISAWNSHSYPNPAFSSPPLRSGQNSLRGYEYEFNWWAKHTDKKQEEMRVYITETGWEDNARTHAQLHNYYSVAYEKIWSADERIVAVTPFLLRGAPGPFAKFSLLDKDLKPTAHYNAFWQVLKMYQPPKYVYN